jgi:predicted helicase
MLIQHILTERLIREIFDNPEFVRRNVIAAEVEKVMLAMTSQSFDRNTYLKELDRFYVAIEQAARTMTDFSDKQHFLNTVSERFFQGYSVKLADTMGIVYTPQEIVDFMCASVEEVLKTEFGKTLASDDVYIIDPCTGTGNFIVNLIRRIPKAKLEAVYKHRLFANEIMLLPYYIAALNIEHAYFEQADRYEAFEGLCFVDTLGLAEDPQSNLSFMTEANTARVQRQRAAPINVVVGNPPYNAHQEGEHDDNRNRTYDVIDARIRETYAKDSIARNKVALSDPYVKFFRWASDRIGKKGVVMFVSNNSFLEAVAFDGVRKHLARDFSRIYTIDLKGNIRKDSMRDGIPLGENHTVFGLGARVGVSVTCLIKRDVSEPSEIHYAAVHFRSTREEKFAFLSTAKTIAGIDWKKLAPDERGTWLQPGNASEFAKYIAIASVAQRSTNSAPRDTIFKTYARGLETTRDSWVYSATADELASKMRIFVETFNSELDRWKRSKRPDDLDKFLIGDETKIKWSSSLKQYLRRERYLEFSTDRIRLATYRPFQQLFVYADPPLIHRPGLLVEMFPPQAVEETNALIALTDLGSEKPFMVVGARTPTDLHVVGAGSAGQAFPFYIYDEDGSNRRENITDWALAQFREHYKDKKIDKWAIFHYVYGVVHHRGYREKFADNLKQELPRIPFAPDFHAFAAAGKELAKLHLDYEKLKPWKLELEETPGMPLSYRVEDKMRLSKDKTQLKVNPSLALSGIPPEAFEYRLGNRSALDWVIDQYQVSTDKRSGITSDPNREDDEQYIVRLVGQVIRVSVETVKIVKELPKEFA